MNDNKDFAGTLLTLMFLLALAAFVAVGVLVVGGPRKVLEEAGLSKPQVEAPIGNTGGQPWPTAPTPTVPTETAAPAAAAAAAKPAPTTKPAPAAAPVDDTLAACYADPQACNLASASRAVWPVTCQDDGVKGIDGVPIFHCYDEAQGCPGGYVAETSLGSSTGHLGVSPYYRMEVCGNNWPACVSTYDVVNAAGVAVTFCLSRWPES